MATLVCKQCGHENEGERVYCHNCGTKLDRSLLPEESTKGKKESLREQRRRVKKLTTPHRGFFVGWNGKLVNALVWAALAAAVVQAMRPPEGVPPTPTKDQLMDTPQIRMTLEDAKAARVPQRVVMDEQGINAYLAGTIRSNAVGPMGGVAKFDRAFVNLEEGVCRISAQQSIYDFPLYAGTAYQLAAQGDALVATNVGGNIGRLPLHPLVMNYADIIFQKLWESLKREHELLNGMQSVEVKKGQIILVTKPAPLR